MTDFLIDSLSVTLSRKKIIAGFSASLPAGKVIGLIGPNGAGKSTLLKACLGLIKANGQVFYRKQSLLNCDSELRAQYLSYLPQERELAWAMTVEEIIKLGATRKSQNVAGQNSLSDDARVQKAIQRLELSELRQRLGTTLSGGELARVLIARLLVQDTPIILADEPLAGLDPQHQIKVMKLFNELTQEGKTVLVSIHDLSLAASWCDDLLLLDSGNLVASGKPSEVLTKTMLRNIYKIDAHIEQRGPQLIVQPIDTVN